MDDVVMIARLLIRTTATLSLLLFLLVYLAVPLPRLTGSKGWRAQRRRLGLAFAASHGVHLVAVLAYAALDPAGFQRATTPFSIASGAVAYAFIAAMVATSWPTPRRWLGERAWHRLHTAGLHFLWLSFVVAYAKRVPAMAGYSVPLLMLLGAAALRGLAARKGLQVRRSVQP
ncbi:hypothetical protein NYO99_17930 [Pelomonas sp. UHG3]|jgi:DMSO/TMAO reductase YedYZ heme-binding membrane subunit|uniref:Uncharacterized protein n=1 Tax=Roseateles hydrophilus TaxID=2975054 RepID=A0ACC6CF01_9BURK|nr:ferric reductase-like transmembrane domain-containing protein [Pelomonas sp. UHG3]MCY4746859.1 hypothetical protein [Pelomonas sp. UHG3]